MKPGQVLMLESEWIVVIEVGQHGYFYRYEEDRTNRQYYRNF